MEDKLVEFANLLRQNGVRVSLAETLDALAASGMIGLGERDAFRGALRATMIKRASELPVFEELFDVYFSGLGEIIKQAGQGVQDALSMSDQEFQKFLDQVEEMLKQQGDKLSELARELLQNRSGQLEKRLREAARAVRLQGVERTIEENYFARALARALGLDKLEQEIRELREQIQKLEFGAALKAQLEKYLDRRLKALEDIIRRYVRMEREKRDLRAREEQRLNQLSDKSFYYLSDEELDRMKEAVTRLAQRLKNVLAVRRKHAKKGRFDIKRTLRQQPGVRRRAVQAALREAPARKAAGGHPVRRVGLGAQRLALHAAVRVLAAGPLLAGAQLRLRLRHRRGHRALPLQRHQGSARHRAQGRPHQRLRAFRFRPRVSQFRAATISERSTSAPR